MRADVRQHYGEVRLKALGSIGDRLHMAESLEAIALARHALDDASEARRLIADADAIRDEVSAPRPPAAVAAIASAFGEGSA